MLWGYCRAALDRAPRYDDGSFRRFLRRYQRDALLRGKHAATSALDESWRERALPEGAGGRERL